LDNPNLRVEIEKEILERWGKPKRSKTQASTFIPRETNIEANRCEVDQAE